MQKKVLYHFVKENEDNTIEYFNFEKMRFENIGFKELQDEQKLPPAKPLPMIDSMTSMFATGTKLEDYLIRDPKRERRTNATYKIICEEKNGKKTELEVIWDDPKANAFSKVSDGEIDFLLKENVDTLNEILDRILNRESGFARAAVFSKNESTRLEDKSKRIIEIFASSKKLPSKSVFMDVFKKYIEFRALYLSHKHYSEKNYALKDAFQKLLKQKNING